MLRRLFAKFAAKRAPHETISSPEALLGRELLQVVNVKEERIRQLEAEARALRAKIAERSATFLGVSEEDRDVAHDFLSSAALSLAADDQREFILENETRLAQLFASVRAGAS